MPDRSIPLFPVAMLCTKPIYLVEPLPEGYAFETFRPGLEEAWCAIQCSVRAFPDAEAARLRFDRDLAPDPEQLARRLVFVCDGKHRPVATAALWRAGGRERICWLAVVPGMHRRGLGKALTARLLELYREEGCAGGLCLTTQTVNYRAINIFYKFGFIPDRGGAFLPEPQSEAEFVEAWRAVDKRLELYERRRGPAGTALDSAVYLDKKSGVRKSSMCRAFVLNAPHPYGETPHYHDYFQVWYVTRGSCEHEVEGQTYEMNVGDVFFIPPGVTHSTRLQPGGSIISCEFNMDQVLSRSADADGQMQQTAENVAFMMLFQKELFNLQPKLTLSRDNQQQMERLLETMVGEYDAADDFFEDFLQLQVLQLLLIFSREYARLPVREESEKVYAKYRSMVETAIRYIDQHFDEPLTLSGMCRISMVSKTYFCYIFKLLTHQTFIEYLMERRVERAMTLLRETEMSIIEIGQTVGFHEPTHFSRTFKKLRGISPREYRSAAKDWPLENAG